MDEKSDLEVYFRLNETERRILRAAAKMGGTPLACSVFELYYPTLSPERLRFLREEIRELKE